MQSLSPDEHMAVSLFLWGVDTLKVSTLCRLPCAGSLLGELRRRAWHSMAEAARLHYLGLFFYSWLFEVDWGRLLCAYWTGTATGSGDYRENDIDYDDEPYEDYLANCAGPTAPPEDLSGMFEQ